MDDDPLAPESRCTTVTMPRNHERLMAHATDLTEAVKQLHVRKLIVEIIAEWIRPASMAKLQIVQSKVDDLLGKMDEARGKPSGGNDALAYPMTRAREMFNSKTGPKIATSDPSHPVWAHALDTVARAVFTELSSIADCYTAVEVMHNLKHYDDLPVDLAIEFTQHYRKRLYIAVHPDKCPDDKEWATEAFKALDASFKVILSSGR